MAASPVSLIDSLSNVALDANKGGDDVEDGYYLGIDLGTQGLTALLVQADANLTVVASGEAPYGFIPHLEDGVYEQNAQDWEDALESALAQVQDGLLRHQQRDSSSTSSSSSSSSSSVTDTKRVLAVCVAGQMHGQVMVDANGAVIGTVRLWCDARNEDEAEFLTNDLFRPRRRPRNAAAATAGAGPNKTTTTTSDYDHDDDVGCPPPVKVPKRATVARWLWTVRNRPDLARRCAFLTTPAGWLTYRLTGGSSKSLGIGDASGMFPIDATRLTYRRDLLDLFDSYIDETYNNNDHHHDSKFPRLSDILPEVLVAGQVAGRVVAAAAAAADGSCGGKCCWPADLLPPGTPIAPAEGDQPASLAGSLIGETGMISCSFGTSVVANMVMARERTPSSEEEDRAISPAVDHFCAPNGQPIYMVWLRNGTTFMNSMVASLGGNIDDVMSQVVEAPADCGGLMALPFLDDEPGLDVKQSGTALVIGYNNQNNRPCHVIKAALTSVMFNLYLGVSQLEPESSNPPTSSSTSPEEDRPHIVLTGGLTKTPQTGQMLADIFDRPVRLLHGADEGCAWGAAVLARYTFLCEHRQRCLTGDELEPDGWPAYLAETHGRLQHEFLPQGETVATYREMLHKYRQLLHMQPDLDRVMNNVGRGK